MQGGHHPDLGVDYYEDLFSSIKARYKIHLHALSPPEIQHIARRSKLTIWETLSRLRDAGLDSLPGGGGEILVDRVRDIIAPKKTNSDEWLDVMRHAHRLGHVDDRDDDVRPRRDARRSASSTCAGSASCRTRRAASAPSSPGRSSATATGSRRRSRDERHADLVRLPAHAGGLADLPRQRRRTSSRSWVTQGLKIGQVALGFGADDMGSVMIEENVVSAAGTTHRTSTEELVHLIRSLGKTPGAARHAVPRGQGLLAGRPESDIVPKGGRASRANIHDCELSLSWTAVPGGIPQRRGLNEASDIHRSNVLPRVPSHGDDPRRRLPDDDAADEVERHRGHVLRGADPKAGEARRARDRDGWASAFARDAAQARALLVRTLSGRAVAVPTAVRIPLIPAKGHRPFG